ncbi:MAG: chemotaxis protein CheW [Negativicutes bacterium]|nr:chemotaxis protein CheW [Negativicutes bacterium]
MTEEQVVIFQVENEEYALRMADAKEIVYYQEAVKLPHTPAYMEGMIMVHGQSIPVVNLSAKFGLPSGKNPDRRIIITEIGARKIGVAVDAVNEVLYLATANIEPTSGGSSDPGACIKGIGKVGKRLIVLLDLGYLFSGEELNSFQGACCI